VFKNKQGEDDEVVRNKARLATQGYSQVEGRDFGETFVHVACLEAIRILLAFVTSKGFKLYQIDVKSAFLNAVIFEEVFVEQPPGFENPKYLIHVYKLSKALYGLKQALRAWYARLKFFLLEHWYVMGSVDKTLFTLKHGNDFFTCSDIRGWYHFRWLFSLSCVKFSGNGGELVPDVHDGRTNLFLGIQVKQTKEGTFVHQAKYAKDMIKKFAMADAKPVSTPISTMTALDPDEDGEAVDQREYRSMIGSLLYLTATRLDIQFTVCLCACFQASPHTSHHQAVQRIFKYIK
jgi:hypothetical protein